MAKTQEIWKQDLCICWVNGMGDGREVECSGVKFFYGLWNVINFDYGLLT